MRADDMITPRHKLMFLGVGKRTYRKYKLRRTNNGHRSNGTGNTI